MRLFFLFGFSIIVTSFHAFADDWVKKWPGQALPDDRPLNLPVNNSLYLPPGEIVQVERYEARTQAYTVKLLKNDRGTIYHIKRQNLADAIIGLDRKTLKRKPNSVVGGVYKIDEEVKLVETLDPRRPRRIPLRSPAGS